jgi:hypothetical protein
VASSNLSIAITAVDRASRTLGSIGSKMGGLAGKATGLGAALGGALAVGGLVAFGTESVRAFSEAQAAQTRLADAYARFPALAGGNIDALRDYNAEMARKTRFDDDAFASGQAVLAQFGLNENQLRDLSPLLADYAAKTGQDLPTAAGLIGRAMMGNGRALKALGINFKATGDKAKDLTTIQGLLAAKVGGFASKDAKTAQGQLEILKNRFGEVKESIGGALLPVLTWLMNVIANQVMPIVESVGSKFSGIANAIGILFNGSKGSVDNFAVAMDNVFGGGGKLIPFFKGLGQRVKELAAWIKGTGIPALKRLGNWLKDKVVAAAKEMWHMFEDNVLPKLKEFGGYIKDTVIPAVKDFGAWLVRYQGWLIPIAAGIGAIVASLKIYNVVMGIVRAATAAWAAIQTVLNVILTANPIGLIVLAIVGLIAMFVVAYKRSETFRNIVQGVLRAVGAAFTWLKDKAIAAWNWIRDKWNGMIEFFRNLKERVKTVAGNIWQTIKDKARDVAIWAAQKFWSLVDTLKSIKKSITDKAKSLWDGLKGGLVGVVNWITDKINFILGGVNAVIRGVNRLPGPDIPEIPLLPMIALAKGGIVTGPTTALIGEAGPEAVIPLNRARGLGGTTIVVNTGIGDPRAIAAEVKRVLSGAGARGQVAF